MKAEKLKAKEIDAYRQDLCKILNISDDRQRQKDLVELAKKVGAGYVHTKYAYSTVTEHATGREIISNYDSISESELVLNINNALQTETMINTCKIANRSWIVAIIAVVIAVIAAYITYIKQ